MAVFIYFTDGPPRARYGYCVFIVEVDCLDGTSEAGSVRDGSFDDEEGEGAREGRDEREVARLIPACLE
jgi:hypothetical protein